jgi:hypothetical protein
MAPLNVPPNLRFNVPISSMIECHCETLLNLMLTMEQGTFFTIECHCKTVLNSTSITKQKIYCQICA